MLLIKNSYLQHITLSFLYQFIPVQLKYDREKQIFFFTDFLLKVTENSC
ncbi:hypothetical protein B4140_2954 [Bacillus amyloliquefaciens]|nr:hypothetical protein B4140_2954 [Bacillus amyloliquefaciens]